MSAMEDKCILAEAFCLGQYLAEEMEAREWTVRDVAMLMGPLEDYGINALTLQFAMAVQDDCLLLDAETDAKLAQAFGVTPGFFRNLHEAWRRAMPERRQPFDCPEYLLDA